jgi:hypothetical protein
MSREGQLATGFRPGDVVRDAEDGSFIGVVVTVELYRENPDRYELHVDMPDQGIGIWDPSLAVHADDPESLAEARRHQLRGLPPEEDRDEAKGEDEA